jgi:Domain of unknown function (DUF4276)
MNIEHVEVVVEEPSMEEALRAILPKILGDMSFAIYRHRCKDDLLLQLPKRLHGYSKFLPSNWRVIVIVDRDDDECMELKAKLEDIAGKAKLKTRTRAGGSKCQVINRIVIEELEAWYFGDWTAVKAAYPKVPTTIPSQARFRHADAIQGTWEAFERVLQSAGYFNGGLRKIEAARAIAPHMDPRRNASRSFQALHSALREMV